MREFPLEYESQKEIQFFPEDPKSFAGDILEIGPGRGDFALSVAERCRDKKVVVIELDRKRYYKLIPRIEKKSLSNIQLIQGNARIVLPKHYKSASFEKIYVLFPDPWPKKRHVPHRLMSVEFITLLSSFLKKGGELFAATDFWSYAEMVVDNAARIPELKNMGHPYFTDISKIACYSPSMFETMWREEGRAIYYMHFTKK